MIGLLVPILMHTRGNLNGLNGHTIISSRATPLNADARVEFQSDGTIDERIDSGSASLIDATEWFSKGPITAIGADYEVRYTNRSGTDFTIRASEEDAWISLSDNRVYQMSFTSDTPGTSTITCDFEVRHATSLATISGSFTVTATVVA